MALRLSDKEIGQLLMEAKLLPEDYRSRIQTKTKRGHEERELYVKGEGGSEFCVILRKSLINPLDFSVILALKVPKTNQFFRLRRYNGKSHEHTNKLEQKTFYDFHIHMATERYQDESGRCADSYAEPTDRFADFNGAIRCLMEDCGFKNRNNKQRDLFERD